MAVVKDTTATGNVNGANSIPLTLSTSGTNRLILIGVHTSNGNTVSSITGTGLTFVKVDSQLIQSTNGNMEVWRAFASAQLSSLSITVNLGSGFPQATAVAITFSGTDTSGTNGSGAVGAEAKNQAQNNAPSQAITTTVNNALGIAFISETSVGAITAGTSQTIDATATTAGSFSKTVVEEQNSATATSGTVVTMTGTLTGNPPYGIIAIEVKPPSNATTNQTQTGKARIQAVANQTITGKGDIRKTTTQTQPGIARIQQVVPQTITGKASILGVGAFANGYSYFRAITIDHTKVGATDQTDFPFLLSVTDVELRTLANGGNVQNSSGFDIIVTSDSAGLSGLNFEVERYISSTGELVMWVRLGTLSHTVDTTIYIWYGNSSITTDQSNPTGVWDSNYVAVYHMNQDPSGTAPQLIDSTINALNQTTQNSMTSAELVSGAIGKDINFNGGGATTQYASKADTGTGDLLRLGSNPVSVESWVKPTALSNESFIFSKYSFSLGQGYSLGVDTGGKALWKINGGNSVITSPSTVISTGTLAQIVGTYNQSAGSQLIYVNGSLNASSSTAPTSMAAYTGAANIAEASDGAGSASFTFKGELDEIRISKIARSADWILTEYNNYSSPSTFFSYGAQSAAPAGTTRTQTGKARIQKVVLQTITGLARIQKTGTQTTTGKSRIQQIVNKVQTGLARITASTPRTQTGKARITATSSQTQTGKSRIQQIVNKLQTGLSRITASTAKTITGKSRITANSTQTTTGKARVTASTNQPQTGKSRITNSTNQIITGKGAIRSTTTKTQTGLSRIQQIVLQTITGKGNINVGTNVTVTGKARIQQSVSQTQTGKSRIQKVVQQAQTGLSRIQQVLNKTQTGLARITASTNKTQTGKASIRNTTTQTQTGKSRIQKVVPQTITGVGRIQPAVQKTQTGKGAIRNTTTQITTGKARMQAIVLKTQLGLARIQQVVLKTIQGVSRIQKSVTQTITGKARIQLPNSNQTITGKARVQKINNQTQTGVARVFKTVQQAQTGKGRIGKITIVNQFGVSHIAGVTNRTITGTARIHKPTVYSGDYYTPQGTTFTDMLVVQNTAYLDLYMKQNTGYQEKYNI